MSTFASVLTCELWGVFRDDLGENWSRYNGIENVFQDCRACLIFQYATNVQLFLVDHLSVVLL